MNYKKAIQYIDTFYNYEKSLSQKKSTLSLSRIKELDKLYIYPHKAYPVIHIVGTKGKGSVVCMLSSVLEHAGYKVGMYTSPHIFNVRERIKINNKDISTKAFTALVLELKLKMKKYPKKQMPTYFELLTEICFEYFKKQKVDIAIIETGLGGRYDATNIVKPVISVITPIGYDHQKQLGETLEKIAFEKAGIIKSKGICISAKQTPSVNKVLKQVCDKNKAILFKANNKLSNFPIGLKGEHQKQNASIVLKTIYALKAKGFKITENNIKQGLQKAYLPGRFDIICKKPNVILDAAHNEESAKALVETYKQYFSKQAVLVFGILKDKNIKQVVSQLKPIFSKVVLVKMVTERAMKISELAPYFHGKEVYMAQNMSKAYNKARSFNKNIIITGSFYLLAEAYKINKNK